MQQFYKVYENVHVKCIDSYNLPSEREYLQGLRTALMTPVFCFIF